MSPIELNNDDLININDAHKQIMDSAYSNGCPKLVKQSIEWLVKEQNTSDVKLVKVAYSFAAIYILAQIDQNKYDIVGDEIKNALSRNWNELVNTVNYEND